MSSPAFNRAISDTQRSRSSPYARPSSRGQASSDDRWQHDKFHSNSRTDHLGQSLPNASTRYQPSTTPTSRLKVQGLHFEVTQQELESLFGEIGPVEKLFLKYDRSGRPTGEAIVQYTTAHDATRAKEEYDGANAKGQPITITFEFVRGPGPARFNGGAVQGNGNGSLQSRISTDLLTRMGGGGRPQPPANAPTGPSRLSTQNAPTGPAATTRGRGAGARGRGGSRAVAPRGGRAAAGTRSTPKTATDLDAELEAFMSAPPASNTAVATTSQDDDVAMD